jgi:hypothetical protein
MLTLIFAGNILDRIADLMYYTGLHFGGRINAGNGFGKTF